MKRWIKLLLFCFLFVSAGRAWAEPVQVNITGEERFRPEMRNNKDFNSSVEDDQAYIGQRIRLNFDIKTESGIKAMITAQDSRNWGYTANAETAGNTSANYTYVTTCTQAQVNAGTCSSSTSHAIIRPSDKQSLDLYQAWFMIENIGGAPVDLKIGRQQLVYGDQRLLGHFGWSDNGRAFDAYKVIARLDVVQLDFFLAKLKETGNAPSNSYNDDDLYGLYSIWSIGGANKLDVYYLVWKTDATTQGRKINTVGARLAGKAQAFDYTAEFASQSGKWLTGVNQSASAMAITGGYTFADVLGGLRLGLEYDNGSGDDKGDATVHKSFAFPFGTNHLHYGYMDYFGWANMTDMAIKAKAKPASAWTTEIAYHIFKLNQANDGWYAVATDGSANIGNTSYTGNTKTDAGSEIDLTVIYQYNAALKVTFGYSTFSPGDAAKEHGGGSDGSTWGYTMFEFAF